MFRSSQRETENLCAYPSCIRPCWKDRSGVLWISFSDGGLRKYDSENQQFPAVLEHGKQAVLEDKNGLLWLADNDNIYSLNRKSDQYKKFKLGPEPVYNKHNKLTIHLYEKT